MVIPISRQMESIVDSTMFMVTTSMGFPPHRSAHLPVQMVVRAPIGATLRPFILTGASGSAQGRESHRKMRGERCPLLGARPIVGCGGDYERQPRER